jgi:mono/diheme cytochrome c family protein
MMKLILWGRRLAALGVVALLACVPARAQNLDQGKSGARLFADSCTACHRSPRGLTKGRFRLTLYVFLQEHYASNSSSAWELASYLESVDDAPRGRPRAAPKRPSGASTSTSRSSVRPPMPIPQR